MAGCQIFTPVGSIFREMIFSFQAAEVMTKERLATKESKIKGITFDRENIFTSNMVINTL